jgi:hypothetical protein
MTSNAVLSTHNVLGDEGRTLPPGALMLYCMKDDASKMNTRRLNAINSMEKGVIY